MTTLTGHVALVTGAAGIGIGQAIARRLATDGAAVVVTDSHERRTMEVAEKLRSDTGAEVLGLTLDVADRDRVDTVLAEVAERLGHVDILVNNAAVNVTGKIWDYDPADWDRGIDVNLTACWYLCRRTMPAMRDAGYGNIVNISSVAPYIGGGGNEAPYAVAKGGLHTLTAGLAIEGGPYGIRVNAVTMGIIKGTRFIDARPELLESVLGETPLRKHGTPVDIANAVSFLVSEQASFITGEMLNVSGGWYLRT